MIVFLAGTARGQELLPQLPPPEQGSIEPGTLGQEHGEQVWEDPSWHEEGFGDHPLDCDSCYLPRYFAELEFMGTWIRGRNLPVLVTTSPPTVAQANAGRLGEATTDILFGGNQFDPDLRSGGRLTFGTWLDEHHVVGMGARFFAIDEDTNNFFAQSDANGTPILARPFFDVTGGANVENRQLVSFENIADGSIASGNISVDSRTTIIGAEFFVRRLLFCNHGNRVDVIGGYTFSRIDDDLRIDSFSTSLDASFLGEVGATVTAFDEFDTSNEFHGGTIGLIAEMEDGPITWRFLGKVSLGNMREQVTISGQQVIVTPDPGGTTTMLNGGLLAQQTNIGIFQRDEFVILPEAGATMTFCLTEHLDFSVGYTFMYWTKVVRAGDQVDTTVNLSQLTGPLSGPARPAFEFNDTHLWLHSMNFMLGWHF